MSSFKDLPEEDKPREKLVSRGASSLTNRELLAILLRTGSSTDNSVLDLANSLLQEADNNLEKLFRFSLQELTNLKGIGNAKASTLLAVFELAHRLRESAANPFNQKFTSPQLVYDYFSPRYSLIQHEEFHIIILNNANKLIKSEKISKGILNSSLVHPREVFHLAIKENAASIILMHNHPSGDATPSEADIQITRQLKDAGELLNIPVIDHLIIARSGYYSFRENGFI